MLGEFLEQNCPDVSVQVVIKSKDDWEEYIDSVSEDFKFLTDQLNQYVSYLQVCRSYGFYRRYCPFVYTLEGELIGDGAMFIEHIRARYCRASVQIFKENQDDRQKDNLA